MPPHEPGAWQPPAPHTWPGAQHCIGPLGGWQQACPCGQQPRPQQLSVLAQQVEPQHLWLALLQQLGPQQVCDRLHTCPPKQRQVPKSQYSLPRQALPHMPQCWLLHIVVSTHVKEAQQSCEVEQTSN